MDKELKERLDREFFEKLPNKSIVNNSRLLICFSEIPEAGKEILAQKIEDKYRALKIIKDDARTLIYENWKIENPAQAEEILDEYMEHFMEKVSKLSNGFVMLVSSVDRRFDKVKTWAEKYGYSIFLIRVETEKEKIIEGWKKRKNEGTFKWYLEQYDRWENDFRAFSQKSTPDFVWKNQDESQLSELWKKIDKKLAGIL